MKRLLKVKMSMILLCILSCCNGVIYPKYTYVFHEEDGTPPFSVKDRLELGSMNDKELVALFERAGNNLDYKLYLNALVKKTYKKLHVSKVLYKTDLEEGILIEGLDYLLPENIRNIDEIGTEYSYVKIYGNYYSCSIDITSNLLQKTPNVNFYKYFNEYKVGDKFNIEFIFHYSFDNEEPKILKQVFTVKVMKGKYVSPAMGW